MSGRIRSFTPSTGTAIPTSNYFQGYMGASGFWSTTQTGSFAALTNTGGNTLTALSASAGFSIAAAGNSLMGIVITPPYASAAYEITATTNGFLSVAAQGLGLQMTDGVTAFAWAANTQCATTADCGFPMVLTGVYFGNTTGPISIQVQGVVQSGTGTMGGKTINSVIGLIPTTGWKITQIA